VHHYRLHHIKKDLSMNARTYIIVILAIATHSVLATRPISVHLPLIATAIEIAAQIPNPGHPLKNLWNNPAHKSHKKWYVKTKRVATTWYTQQPLKNK
jgi:hypothetical protein